LLCHVSASKAEGPYTEAPPDTTAQAWEDRLWVSRILVYGFHSDPLHESSTVVLDALFFSEFGIISIWCRAKA